MNSIAYGSVIPDNEATVNLYNPQTVYSDDEQTVRLMNPEAESGRIYDSTECDNLESGDDFDLSDDWDFTDFNNDDDDYDYDYTVEVVNPIAYCNGIGLDKNDVIEFLEEVVNVEASKEECVRIYNDMCISIFLRSQAFQRQRQNLRGMLIYTGMP